MEPPVLRDEEPPDDAIVVVRGGLLAADSVRRTAAVSMREHGFFGVSVYAALGVSVEELVGATPELGRDRYKQLRATTAGALRGAGFVLLATQARPHYDVVLDDLEDPTIERLRGCFGPPFPNPGP